jgi:superfamily II DNA or RNA helicase
MNDGFPAGLDRPPEGPDAWRGWEAIMLGTFWEENPGEKALAKAEEAVRACPGDSIILCLAATAALLAHRPERALVFLKRLSKRYIPTNTDFLLHALALGQQKKITAARGLLLRYGLTSMTEAYPAFPGGPPLRKWLFEALGAILGEGLAGWRPPRPARTPGRVAGKATAKATGTLAVKAGAKTGPKTGKTAAAPLAASSSLGVPAPVPVLARGAVDVPLAIDMELGGLFDTLTAPPESDAGWYRLRETLAHLSLAQGFDELLCLPHLRGIETFWYQVETVRKVLKQFRGRVLLADEVGLGKTVEAGMVLKEYLLRGMAGRVLVLVPASLVGQWREELESKFAIDCATTYDPLLRDDPGRFWSQPRIIASIAVARRREHAERLLAQSFDVVVVDEAHHLKDRTSQGYKLVDGLNKRFLLLLSATPVQNNLLELYNLLTLLKPGIFKTQKEFRAAYMSAGKPRQPSNPERLRELVRGAMIRNTRAVVALRLPRRHAATLRVDGGEAERACYRDTAALARQLAADGSSGRHRLVLHHLLGAAGSSPAAAAAAASRMAARPDGASAWRTLAKRWAAVPAGGKETALLDLLRRNPVEKKLVFVHHRETMDHLAGLLEGHGMAFARFDGSLAGPAKDAAIADFRDRVPVLLTTESGGEGRNIQFCNTLINFDIPWNPMAIEQRIGRIDRIGQTREVFVFNLVSADTLEDQVLRILDEKINMFELVVGEVGAILGEVDDEHDFAGMVLDAWLEAGDEARAQAFEGIGTRLTEARRRHEDAKELDETLFGEDYETA